MKPALDHQEWFLRLGFSDEGVEWPEIFQSPQQLCLQGVCMGVWGSCRLMEGPRLVWLPREPLIEDSAEMTGWGSGCFPASGLVAGCSGTSETFLLTRGHYGFISRTWLCPRFQLGVPLVHNVVSNPAFFTLAKGTQGQLALPTPHGGVPCAQVVLSSQHFTGKG